MYLDLQRIQGSLDGPNASSQRVDDICAFLCREVGALIGDAGRFLDRDIDFQLGRYDGEGLGYDAKQRTVEVVDGCC